MWAALGPRLDKVWTPPEVRRVVVFADNGEAGEIMADKAVRALTERGLAVARKPPPSQYGDWNDVLQERTT